MSFDQLISWINDYFFPSIEPYTTPTPMIVMGTNIPKRPAAHALELYRRHPQTMVLTGGWNSKLQATEAQLMYEYLTKAGVSESHLLPESEAKHTQDNLKFSLALLNKFDLLSDSIQIVTINYHSRRALLCAQEIAPEITWGIQPYSSVHFTHPAWHQNSHACHLILSELTKIATYIPQVTQYWPLPSSTLISLWEEHLQSISNSLK